MNTAATSAAAATAIATAATQRNMSPAGALVG